MERLSETLREITWHTNRVFFVVACFQLGVSWWLAWQLERWWPLRHALHLHDELEVMLRGLLGSLPVGLELAVLGLLQATHWRLCGVEEDKD